MSRIIDDDRALRRLMWRARLVPIVSTMAGSLLALMPVVSDVPLLPSFGLLMLLSWRLLRPEHWPLWIGVPLGAFDDLIGGAPLGSAILLWTLCLLALDAVDSRLIWRDYWQEWLLAAASILFCGLAGLFIAHRTGGGGDLKTIVPQLTLGILLFPVTARIASRLDHWRLGL